MFSYGRRVKLLPAFIPERAEYYSEKKKRFAEVRAAVAMDREAALYGDSFDCIIPDSLVEE